MSDARMSILDRNLMKHVDVFELVLLQVAEESILPEIYEVFGKDATMQFLDTFAGTTITVPPQEAVTDALRDATIYMTLESTPGVDTVQSLALRYEMEMKEVVRAYERVKRLVLTLKDPEIRNAGAAKA